MKYDDKNTKYSSNILACIRHSW